MENFVNCQTNLYVFQEQTSQFTIERQETDLLPLTTGNLQRRSSSLLSVDSKCKYLVFIISLQNNCQNSKTSRYIVIPFGVTLLCVQSKVVQTSCRKYLGVILQKRFLRITFYTILCLHKKLHRLICYNTVNQLIKAQYRDLALTDTDLHEQNI